MCPRGAADVPTAGPSLAEQSKSATGGERLRPGERDGHGGAPRLRFGVSLPRSCLESPAVLLVVFTGVCKGADGLEVFFGGGAVAVWGCFRRSLCEVGVTPVAVPAARGGG